MSHKVIFPSHRKIIKCTKRKKNIKDKIEMVAFAANNAPHL